MSHEGQPARRELFRELFDRHYRRVFRFFRRWGFDAEEADDLAQETFLKAYAGLAEFRGDASESTWLFTIAANCLRNELRKRGTLKRAAVEVSRDELSEAERAEPSVFTRTGHGREAPLERLLRKEQYLALDAAIADLPPKMGRCARLRLEQGLALREIAALLQLSPETVKAHLFQARRRLKRQVAEVFDAVDNIEATSE